ncbi:MAG: TRAP transporter substrate-binding protein DctP [Myxococcota bacterium]
MTKTRTAPRLLLAALAAALLALTACPGERSVYPKGKDIWRFAIEETQGSVQHAYAMRFKELIEERSGGDIHVVVYTYGTLGTSDQITEQLHNGTLEFAMASPGHIGKLIPELQVFLLHFAFSEDPQVNKRALQHDEALRSRLDDLYARKGFKFLDAFAEGWMVWTTSKSVRTPEDLEGVKMRVMTSPLLLAAYEAYGASATPLPYSEVYSALQLNMIDGQVNPIFAIEEMSFYEVTSHLVFPRHAQFFTTAMTNRGFYRDLSPDRREMLDGVITDLHDYIFDVQRRFNAERLDEMLENKPELEIVRLTEEERAAFRERAKQVWDRYVEMVGPTGRELLDIIRAAVERAEEEVE